MAETANAVAEASDYVFVAIFIVAVALWLRYQRRVIRQELEQEMKDGLISREEWEAMPRYLSRSKQYWGLLWAGKPEHWRQLKRIHGELVDLAFLKWRLRRTGGDWNEVERRRRRIANLQSQEVVE